MYGVKETPEKKATQVMKVEGKKLRPWELAQVLFDKTYERKPTEAEITLARNRDLIAAIKERLEQ